MIEFKNVYKAFGENIIYNDFNIKISTGERFVIIGQSGVGKSVLLKHIVGLILPDKGSVIVDNINIVTAKSSKIFKLRKNFGFVFQGGALFDSMTVGENIALPLVEHSKLSNKEIKKKVLEKLDMVGLNDTENLTPVELSGGMQKRVAIARAIVMDPNYILYDEPTTGLDPILADKINELIIDLNERLNTTSIVVTHDISSAYSVATKISMLYKGKIIFSDTPDKAKKTTNPYLKQFLSGKSKGPIVT